MCKLYYSRPTKRKYCYKIYWLIKGSLYTIYTTHKHIIGKRYKAINVKLGRKISNVVSEHVTSAGYRHVYDPTQIGFMGYVSKDIAEAERIPDEYVVVKCLMENARIDVNGTVVDCQYLTPLEIVKE